jgi:hypothetical protein
VGKTWHKNDWFPQRFLSGSARAANNVLVKGSRHRELLASQSIAVSPVTAVTVNVTKSAAAAAAHQTSAVRKPPLLEEAFRVFRVLRGKIFFPFLAFFSVFG